MEKRKQKTRIIGMRELRQNLSKLIEEAQKKNIHFVVLRHGKIAGHVVTPPTDKELELQELAQEVAEARTDYRKGNYCTQEEVERELGLT